MGYAKGWLVLVEYSGITHLMLAGLDDQSEAELAAVRAVGGGNVISTGALSEDEVSKVALPDGRVVRMKWQGA